MSNDSNWYFSMFRINSNIKIKENFNMNYTFEISDKYTKKIITYYATERLLEKYTTSFQKVAESKIEEIIIELKKILPVGHEYNLDLVYNNLKDNDCPLYLLKRTPFSVNK